MSATRKMQEVEQERGKPIADILQELYEEHGSQQAVAAALGVTQGTISLWLLRAGLAQKTIIVRRDQIQESA